jgi:hypothetical protein
VEDQAPVGEPDSAPVRSFRRGGETDGHASAPNSIGCRLHRPGPGRDYRRETDTTRMDLFRRWHQVEL